MPTVEIPVNIRWNGATGSPGVNVWHARTDGAIPDPADPGVADMLDALQAFYTSLSGFVPSEVAFQFDGEIQGVGGSAGESQTYDPWTVQGLGPDGFLPPANCVLVSWRTSTGGRSGRGRTFLGPMGNGAQAGNGQVASDVQAGIQAAVNQLVDTSGGLENGALGVYSRTDNLFRDFTSGAVRSSFAVLRSRRD